MTVPVRRCLYVFSLRQGTLLIGTTVLLMSSFSLFLLILGSTHAYEMATMLEEDIEVSAEREGIVLFEETDSRAQNELVLHKAHNLAIVVVVWFYIGVALATLHFTLCVMMLYGTIWRVRKLLVPWICMALLGLILCCTAMLVSMYLVRGTKAIIIFISSSAAISIGFYMWLVVYSHYIECGEIRSCIKASTHVSISSKSITSPTNV